MFLLIAILLTAAVVLLGVGMFPFLSSRLEGLHAMREQAIARETDKGFYDLGRERIMRLQFILPLILGILAFVFSQSFLVAFFGAAFALFIPSVLLKIRDGQRRNKFNNQILDAIMVLSSSLKGGLSLLQAFEVLTEEMPVPMSQEIGLVVRENKMGVSLEDCLVHLNKRMDMEELRLVVNSILVARETGGDLTKVLGRLSITIRDNRKLKDSIKTLTLQGRLQGIIMSALPFLFVWWVLMFNRKHFDIMLNSQQGRVLLIIAVVLQLVGMILIKKFSTIKV
ncbi:MAG: type II secretion system F family protein [Candidatus Omnitrophota bacterium]|nr:type II secretion system F family protein [Candidatus Omnitrophota bacterium]